MNLIELCNMSEKDLNKMSKAAIITEIKGNYWAHKSAVDSNKNLTKEVAALKAPYDQSKLMIIGMVDYEPPVDEYSKKPILDQVSLPYLIGMLIKQLVSSRGD